MVYRNCTWYSCCCASFQYLKPIRSPALPMIPREKPSSIVVDTPRMSPSATPTAAIWSQVVFFIVPSTGYPIGSPSSCTVAGIIVAESPKLPRLGEGTYFAVQDRGGVPPGCSITCRCRVLVPGGGGGGGRDGSGRDGGADSCGGKSTTTSGHCATLVIAQEPWPSDTRQRANFVFWQTSPTFGSHVWQTSSYSQRTSARAGTHAGKS